MERVLGRLFFAFFWRLLPVLLLFLEGESFLDERRRLRLELEEREDLLLSMEEDLVMVLVSGASGMDMFGTLRRLGFPVSNKSEELSDSFPRLPLKSSDSGDCGLGRDDDGLCCVEKAGFSLLICFLGLGTIPILAAVRAPDVLVALSRKLSSPFSRTATNLVLNTLLSPQIFVVLLTFSTSFGSLLQINFKESPRCGLKASKNLLPRFLLLFCKTSLAT